jgi:hypothetical protein
MPFDVGPTVQTTNGYGFAIRNTHKGAITFIAFATREEAEKAEAEIREAIKNAVTVTDTHGRTW